MLLRLVVVPVPGLDKAVVRTRLLEKLRPNAKVDLKLEPLPKPAPAPPAVVLDAAPLLTEDDLRTTLGAAGPFTVEPLAGDPTTAEYAARHFQATGKPETSDLAFRVWMLTTDAANKKYDELRANLSGSKVVDQVGDSSFEATEMIPRAPIDIAGSVSASSPHSTRKSAGTAFTASQICVMLPEASLTPATCGIVASRASVAGSTLQPVRPGTL